MTTGNKTNQPIIDREKVYGGIDPFVHNHVSGVFFSRYLFLAAELSRSGACLYKIRITP